MHTHSRTRERPHARTHTWPHTHTPADAQAVPCQARPAGQPGLTFHGGGRAGHDHIRCRAISETRLGRRPRQSRAMWQHHDENSAPDPLARRARLPARTDSTPYAAAAVAAAQASCYRISCCHNLSVYVHISLAFDSPIPGKDPGREGSPQGATTPAAEWATITYAQNLPMRPCTKRESCPNLSQTMQTIQTKFPILTFETLSGNSLGIKSII